MKYYKVIKNKEFIGIGTTLNLRRFQAEYQIMLICNETEVQYISLDDVLYRANWMWPENTDSVKYEIADVIRIEKDEYDLLLNAVETNEEIAIEVKSSSNVTEKHLKGLKALREEGIFNRYVVVCQEEHPRITDGIEILPWKYFFEELWKK